MTNENQAPEGAPAGWPSGIDIADEIDSLLPASMGYSTRAAVEQWWRDLVARKLSKLAAPSPAEGDERAAAQSAPEGFRLVLVNEAFDDLMYWLDRCESKGHMENCADLIEPWSRFDYRAAPTPSQAEPDVQPKGTPAGYALIHEDALRAWGKLDEVRAACVYPVAAPSVPSPAVGADDARDAARYRFLRDADRSDQAIDFTMLMSLAMDSMDAAIDEAMQGEPTERRVTTEHTTGGA